MAKIITRITSDNVISLNGTALRIGEEGGTTTAYSADQLRPAEYSSSGNRITLRRESDGALILSAVLFSEIKNGNTGQLFATSDELQQYMLKFQVGDAEPGNGVAQPVLTELTDDLWDFYEAPSAYIALTRDENLKTINDEEIGSVYALEAEQIGKGGYKLTINGKDIPVDKAGSTFVAARVKHDGNVAFVSGAEIADDTPQILTNPESKRTVVNDYADLYADADNYNKVELIFNKEIISNIPAHTVQVGPETVGSYVFRFYKGDKIEDTQPAFIHIAEAKPLTLNSQPSDATVDVGSTYNFLPDYSAVPPPRVSLYSVDGSTVKKIADVPSTGYNGVIKDTLTYKYGAVYQLPGEPAEPPLYSNTFTIKANKLVQAPPTNPVNDDAANTFSWTDAAGKTFADMEYSIFNATPADVSAKPLPVGDRDLAVGDVRVRYKQTDTHNASVWLSNVSPFVGTPLLQPFPGSGATVAIDNVAVNGTTFKQGSVQRSGSEFGNDIVSKTRSFPAGAPCKIQFEINNEYLRDGSYGVISRASLNTLLQDPELGNIRNQLIGVMWSSSSGQMVHKNGYTALENIPIGNYQLGDTVILERREKQSGDTMMPWYYRVVRSGMTIPDVKLAFANDDELIPHIAIAENTTAGIYNPMYYGTKPIV